MNNELAKAKEDIIKWRQAFENKVAWSKKGSKEISLSFATVETHEIPNQTQLDFEEKREAGLSESSHRDYIDCSYQSSEASQLSTLYMVQTVNESFNSQEILQDVLQIHTQGCGSGLSIKDRYAMAIGNVRISRKSGDCY